QPLPDDVLPRERWFWRALEAARSARSAARNACPLTRLAPVGNVHAHSSVVAAVATVPSPRRLLPARRRDVVLPRPRLHPQPGLLRHRRRPESAAAGAGRDRPRAHLLPLRDPDRCCRRPLQPPPLGGHRGVAPR